MTFFIAMFFLVMQFLWKYIDDLIGKAQNQTASIAIGDESPETSSPEIPALTAEETREMWRNILTGKCKFEN